MWILSHLPHSSLCLNMDRADITVLGPILVFLNIGVAVSKEFYVEKNDMVTWYKAHIECMRKGYEGLATAYNEEEEKELAAAIQKEAPWDGYFWIGLTDLGHKRKYVWFTTGKEQSDHLNWAPGEPMARDGEDCIAILKTGWNDQTKTGEWKWNDDICDGTKAKYICQK